MGNWGHRGNASEEQLASEKERITLKGLDRGAGAGGGEGDIRKGGEETRARMFRKPEEGRTA